MQSNPTLGEIRKRAEEELKFKCPEGPIRACMNRNEIPVRRSKAEAERQMLNNQIEELTELVLDLVAHGNLPPEMLQRFKERGRNLNDRVVQALSRRSQPA